MQVKIPLTGHSNVESHTSMVNLLALAQGDVTSTEYVNETIESVEFVKLIDDVSGEQIEGIVGIEQINRKEGQRFGGMELVCGGTVFGNIDINKETGSASITLQGLWSSADLTLVLDVKRTKPSTDKV